MAAKLCVRCNFAPTNHYLSVECPFYVAPAGLMTRLTGAILTRFWYPIMNGSDDDERQEQAPE